MAGNPPGATTETPSGDEAKQADQDSPRQWWKAAGGFMIFFNVWGLPISFGAFQGFYALEYLPAYSASAISWIGTAQSSLLIFVGLVSGPLYDRGHWPLLFASGSFLTVFGMMMLSLSTEYYQVFLSQGVCVGVGCGLLYVPTLTIIGAAFTKYRAIAMGIVTSGIALGGVVLTIVYIELLPAVGFAWTVRVLGFVNLAAFAIAAPMIASGRSDAPPGPARTLFDRSALTDVPFLIFTLVQFFVFLGYLVPLFYLPTFAEVALGADEATALYVLIGSQGASLLGRVAATLPVRKTGALAPWAACCVASSALCFAWIAAHELASFVAFAALYGFASGALIALPPSLFPTICPDPGRLGSRLGVSWTSSGLALLIGSPIAGAISHPDRADFLGVQVWSGAMLLVSGAVLGVLWVLLAKKHKRIWI